MNGSNEIIDEQRLTRLADTGGEHMKKLTVIAVAVAAIMLFAIPAMYYMNNTDLNDQTGASRAFMDMRFRLQTVFKVSDNLSVTTRFDALDNKQWGTGDTVGTASNIDWDRAYLTAKFDLFDLYVGRMSAGTYGLVFNDSGTEADRIKLVKVIDPITVMAIYQKTTEQDSATGYPEVADSDADAYYLSVQYKQEGLEAGLLTAYINDKTNSDISNTDTLSGQSTSVSYDQKYWQFCPYFKATFGPVYLEGELGYKTGKYQDYYDSARNDIDWDAMSYYLYGNVSLGPAKVGLGYAFAEGDGNANDKENNAYGYAVDWEPLLILTGATNDATLGGVSNLNGGNATAAATNCGFKIGFLTAEFSPMENVTLNAIAAKATADETGRTANMDDDYGWEYDVGCKVQLMDNLTYQIIYGFLDAGDLWKQGVAGATVDNTWSLFHKLEVTF
ncbi:MAG: hypothetical protein JRJ42_10010 [Deltaproteobacteria bacterium]|nr:hypothetical protein [Deltaproteobacteria bacterium]